MNQAFSQVLLGMGHGNDLPAVGMLEDVVRTGDADAGPTLAFKAANNIATFGKHESSPFVGDVRTYDRVRSVERAIQRNI
jgi:hypothetical protein